MRFIYIFGKCSAKTHYLFAAAIVVSDVVDTIQRKLNHTSSKIPEFHSNLLL